MSAKHKLNAAQVNGALFVAGLLGLVTGNVIVFLLAAAILIVTGWHSGDIRGGR